MKMTRVFAVRKSAPVVVLFIASVSALVLMSVPIVTGSNWPGEQNVLALAMSLRNQEMTQVISVFTFAGSAVPTLLICIALTLIEWKRVRNELRTALAKDTFSVFSGWRQASWPLFAYTGALVSDVLLRLVIGRLPPQGEQLMTLLPEYQFFFQRYSYPSGHAVTAFVTYGAMMVMAWRRPVPRTVISLLALLIIAVVGFGRLYLGVHWFSDVIAGYTVGIVWLTATVLLYNRNVSDNGATNNTA